MSLQKLEALAKDRIGTTPMATILNMLSQYGNPLLYLKNDTWTCIIDVTVVNETGETVVKSEAIDPCPTEVVRACYLNLIHKLLKITEGKK